MAFSFKSFAGTCKILGVDKFVELAPEYSEEGKASSMLCIHDVDADVAMRIIAAVGNPVVVSPAPVEQVTSAAVAKGEIKAELEAAKEEPLKEKKTRKKRTPKKEPESEASAETNSETKNEEDEFEEKPASTNGISEELKVMKKRGDIIRYLLDQGFDTQEKIMAEVNRVREEVPFLARMRNMEEKFTSAMGVMKIGA